MIEAYTYVHWHWTWIFLHCFYYFDFVRGICNVYCCYVFAIWRPYFIPYFNTTSYVEAKTFCALAMKTNMRFIYTFYNNFILFAVFFWYMCAAVWFVFFSLYLCMFLSLLVNFIKLLTVVCRAFSSSPSTFQLVLLLVLVFMQWIEHCRFDV